MLCWTAGASGPASSISNVVSETTCAAAPPVSRNDTCAVRVCTAFPFGPIEALEVSGVGATVITTTGRAWVGAVGDVGGTCRSAPPPQAARPIATASNERTHMAWRVTLLLP